MIVVKPKTTSSQKDFTIKETDTKVLSSAVTQSSSTRVVSGVFDVQSTDGSTQLDQPLEICLQAEDGAEDGCLGYIDETKNPPEWKCEDDCLDKTGGFLCGKTSHLTNFAILLGGGGVGNGCGSSYMYFTGHSLGDSLTTLFVILLVLATATCIVLFGLSRWGRPLVLGREALRVYNIRTGTGGSHVEL